MSRFFDEKLASVEPSKLVKNAVRKFSFDVLNEILNVYDSVPERDRHFNFEIFPIDKWNISALPSSRNEKTDAKAMGLFISYLEALPMFVGLKNNKANDKRADLLDEIIFGVASQKFSRKMIRIINLYFSQSSFGPYENEDMGHALIRSFIDNDYNFLFIDTPFPGSSFDPNETEEQKIKRKMKKFRNIKKQRDNDTLKLLTIVYGVLLDTKEMKAINKAIADYDLGDKTFHYHVDMKIVGSNLEDLRGIMDKVVKYRIVEK